MQWAGRRVRFDAQARPPADLDGPSLVLIGMRDGIGIDEVSSWLAPAAVLCPREASLLVNGA